MAETIEEVVERLTNIAVTAEACHEGVKLTISNKAQTAADLRAVLSVLDKLAVEVKRLNRRNADLEYLKQMAFDNATIAEAKLSALEGAARSMLWDAGGRPDHMTACERTMGDTHPCTCGAEAFRKSLGHSPTALASLDRTVPTEEEQASDFLKRQTGELPAAPMPAWSDDEGREGRRDGAEEDPEPESWHQRLSRLVNDKDYASALALLRAPAPDATLVHDVGLHPRTAALVTGFAFQLAQKLRRAETKYGWADGWVSNEWEAQCREQLMAHVAKGDPLDVAAYAAFCWHHGWSTASALPAEGEGKADERAWQKRCEQVEFALSQLSRATRRVLDAKEAWRSPDRDSHPNLVLEEAEAWIGLSKCFDPHASPSQEPQDARREKLRALVLEVEDYINLPPSQYAVEPMAVRDYRHALYSVWSPLADAILNSEATRREQIADRIIERLFVAPRDHVIERQAVLDVLNSEGAAK